jgi:2-C-methyl-D-erythritol 4-phosphate cytidylyltransferase
MTTALIFAGGTGQRMNTRTKPKQFLELHGKPIIIYTLEHFENHEMVDNIIVVCIESYIGELKMLLEKFSITKVLWIVPGGKGADKSIYNGLHTLETVCGKDDIVLIHDGVRPLITHDLITANINTAKLFGSAVTIEPVTESVALSKDGEDIENVTLRSEMFSIKAPQSFSYGFVWDLYKKAHDEGVSSFDTAHLCSIYGIKTHAVKSPKNNVKITSPMDYYIFRALFEALENQQIWGIQ